MYSNKNVLKRQNLCKKPFFLSAVCLPALPSITASKQLTLLIHRSENTEICLILVAAK